MLMSIGQAASMIGVSISTLRRWERGDRFLAAMRTIGEHRRYRLGEIEHVFFGRKIKPEARKTLAYARVFSSDQRLDLQSQIATVDNCCKKSAPAKESL